MKSFDASGAPKFVDVHDNTGVTHRGRLLRGRVGAGMPYDFAVARFDDSVQPETFHLAAGRRAPFPLRSSSLVNGEPVFHYSSLRGRRIRGVFRQISTAPVELRLPDGTFTQYANVLVVANENGVPFSRNGDSGSLVVDDANHVIGAILGSSVNAGLAYVVDLEFIEALVPDTFSLLFTRGDS